MSNSNEFAQFIDNLRNSRNITREDFVDGIVSLRQYYRFIKGESSLKNESINALLEKLEINSIESYGRFIRKKNEGLQILEKSYNLIKAMEYDKAKIIVDKIDETDLQSNKDKKFLSFIKASLDFHLEIETEENSMNKIIKIIKYPQILDKEVLTFYEITGLFAIADYLIKQKNDYRIAIFTYEVLRNPKKYYINDMKNTITAFYATAARNLGLIGEVEKSLEMAIKGIKASKSIGTLTSLISLFYYKAIGEFNLNMTNAYQHSLIKLFGLLNAEDDEIKTKFYKQLVYKQLGIKQSDLITYKKLKK